MNLGWKLVTAGALAALLLAACGSAPEAIVGEGASIDSGRDGRDVTTETARSPTTTTPEPPPEEETVLELDSPEGAFPLVWVRRGARVEVRSEPAGGEVVELAGKRTEFGSPTVFSVVKRSGEWAGVTTPYLPNGRLGWVRLDPDRLRAGWTRLAIQVDVSERQAVLIDDEKVLRSFSVTVGAAGYDTPTGRFAVTDTFRGDVDPAAYGCCALALTATQPTVPSGWLGGNRIAIHGTSGPLGVAASHGCIRAANENVSELIDRVPLGAPVFIRA